MNQAKDVNLNIRDLPQATTQELNESLLFVAPLVGTRQHLFLKAPFQELLGELSGESIASGGSEPAPGSGLTGIGQLFYQIAAGKVVNVFFSPVGSDDWIGFSGDYTPRYVRDSDVAVGSNARSGTYYTLTVDEVDSYDRGMILRFRNPVRNLGPVQLRVEGLPFREAHSIRQEPFGAYEFHPNYLHSLLYDGDRWVALDEIEIPLHIVRSADFDFVISHTGHNQIEIAGLDNLVITGNVSQILFRMQGTNTGDVELKFGSGGSIDLLTSRGEQIPAGYLQDGMYVRAVLDIERGVWISDVEGPRALRTQLVASVNIQAGDYAWGQWFAPWTLQPGITGMFLFDLTGGSFTGNPNDTPDAYVGHLRDRLRDSQLGWLLEVVDPNGDAVGSTILLFGNFNSISSTVYNEGSDINFQYFYEGGGEGSGWLHVFNGANFRQTTAIPAGYTINLYLIDN